MGRFGCNLVSPKKKDRDCECGLTSTRENEEDEEEEEIFDDNKRLNQYGLGKKMYFLFFISTTVVACFCIFVVIPQLIDYYTSSSVESNSVASQRQAVIDLLDTEMSRRNQGRQEIMQKFDILQQNYKRLLAEYQNAQENYLKKLKDEYVRKDKLEIRLEYSRVQSTTSPTVESDLEIFEFANE